MKLWPAPGRRVRDPANGQLLTRRGAEAPDNGYWRRRLADGDVLDHPPAAPAKPARTRSPQPPKSPARKDPA